MFATGGRRAEVFRGSDNVQTVQLDHGGAVIPNGTGVTKIRIDDEDDQLIQQRPPNTGLTEIPRF